MATGSASILGGDDGWEDIDGGWEDVAPAAYQPGLVRRGVNALNDVLSIPRSVSPFHDPLARLTSKAAGVNIKTRDETTGTEREKRADELLLQGALPERTPGGRASTEDYWNAALSGSPSAILTLGLGGALGFQPGALGDADQARARLRAEGHDRLADAGELLEDIARRPATFAASLATDPLTLLSGASIGKALGATGKGLQALTKADQALAGAGAVVGGTGAVDATERAVQAAKKGEYREAGLSALDALLAGGMGVLGAKAARQGHAPGVETGRAYIHDPNLTAAERAVLEAEANAPATSTLDARQAALAEGVPEVPARPENPLRVYNAELDPEIAKLYDPEPAAPQERGADRRQDESPAPNGIERRKAERRTQLAAEHPGADPALIEKAAMADEDSLTGLGNRRAFEEAAASGEHGGTAMFDAAGLKWLNDEHGHPAGDAFLKAIGEAFAAEDVAAYRLGGDEFALHAPDEARAAEVAKRVQDRVEKATWRHVDSEGKVREWTGGRLDYGAGTEAASADAALLAERARLQEAGLRAQRGERPVGLAEVPAAGRDVEPGASPAAGPDAQALAEAARGAQERAATAELRAELQSKTAGVLKAPEDLAALAAIRATEAPPAKPRLALAARAREARLANAEKLTSTGPDVRLSPAAMEAARLEGAKGRPLDVDAQVARLQKVAERANDISGRTGSGIQRRAAKRAQAELRDLGLDYEKLTGAPEDATAIRAALDARGFTGLKDAPEVFGRKLPQLRASVTAEPGKLTDPQALSMRERLQQRLAASRQEPAAVDQAAAAKGRFGRAVGRVLRSVQGALEQLPGVGKELAGRVRAFEHTIETTAGAWASKAQRALEALGKSDAERAAAFEQLQPAIEGRVTVDSLPEALRPAAETFRALEQEMGQRMVKAGLLEKGDLIENHWLRVPKDMSVADFGTKARALAEAEAKAGRPISIEEAAARLREGKSLVVGTRAGRRAGAEKVRAAGKAGLQEGQYRTDPGVLFESINEVARRVAESEHLGKNGEVVQALIDRLDPEQRGGSMGDRAYAQAVMDRLRGVKPKGAGSAASSIVRSVQAGTSLVLSPVQQLGSLAQTSAVAGFKPTLRAVKEVFWNPKVTPEGRGLRAAADRVKRSYRQAKLDAAETGALATNLGGDLADLYGTLAKQTPGGGAAGAVGRQVGRLPWLKWAQGIDAAQRVVAAKTAEFFVPKLVEQARTGKGRAARNAQRDLGYLKVDWQAWDGSPEQLADAAKSIADRTQYRVGMSQLPSWASTPLGKLAFQFQSFGYQHTKFMGHLFNEAGHRNFAPLARWAAAAYVIGLGGNEFRNTIVKGLPNDEAPDKDKLAATLVDALQNPTRKNYDAWRDALPSAVAALAAAGGLGVLPTALQKADDLFSGKVLEVALGPAGADVKADLAAAGGAWKGAKDKIAQGEATLRGDRDAAAAAQRSAEKNFANAGKGTLRAVAAMLPQAIPVGPVPVPVPFSEMAKELTSGDEKPERPGWVGRLRDKAEDAGILPVADETQRGAAGRKRAAELARVSERAREVGAENEAQKNERLSTPVGKRLAGAEKRLLREQYEAALIDALRAKDQKRVRKIVAQAARDKVRISYRQLRELTGRVRPDTEDSQEEEQE